MAKITGQGLFAIACSVALLWGCLIGERLTMRRAAHERIRVFREIEELQRTPRPTPASAPSTPRHRLLVTVA